jgi:hypothetical protein
MRSSEGRTQRGGLRFRFAKTYAGKRCTKRNQPERLRKNVSHSPKANAFIGMRSREARTQRGALRFRFAKTHTEKNVNHK